MSDALAYDIQNSPVLMVVLTFLGLYPVVSAGLWVVTAVLYRVRRETPEDYEDVPEADGSHPEDLPFISIIIPAYCEEKVIGRAIRGCLRMDYPNKEIIVVDDGSTDATAAEVVPYMDSGQVCLLRKRENEGKAMATNDAIAIANGELVLVMDADAYPDRDLLRYMVRHFRWPRVAAVTGNPRVANRVSVLSKIQALEFSSTVSLMRRAQRVWGRIMTISGIVGLFRKDALIDAGLYSPDMATEDIDMTWKLQKRWYDVRYEPRAIVWMQVPARLRSLYAQRSRWARGLAQVLRRHADVFTDWRWRRMYPVFLEATLSIIWAALYAVLSLAYVVTYYIDPPPVGANPLPLLWGVLLATVSLLQLGAGVLMDRRYDPGMLRLYILAPLYPLIYWLFLTVTTFVNTPRGLLGRKDTVSLWNIEREG
jgi:biofilm PGA synthesis N-glycosyltransferase PgaC